MHRDDAKQVDEQTRIVRTWSARATPAGADAYVAYFRDTLAPELAKRAGYRGAMVLRRPTAEAVTVTVQTQWSSWDAIRAFAGEAVERAVLEPEACALLLTFDDHVEHFEVALVEPG